MKFFYSFFIIIFFAFTPIARAQFVVSDPGNLAQGIINGTTAASQLANQAIQIKNEIDQIMLLTKNLEKLSFNDLNSLADSFRRMEALFKKAEQLSMKYGSVSQEFDKLYEGYNPDKHSAADLKDFQNKWRNQSKVATRTAMEAHTVIDEYKSRAGKLNKLSSASDAAGGTLAALQAGNKMADLLVRQMMEMNEVIVADSRAKLSILSEKEAREAAGRKKSHDIMFRGYGEGSKETAPNTLPKMR